MLEQLKMEPNAELSIELAMGLMEKLPVGIIISSNDDSIIWCNERIVEFLGDTPENISKLSLTDLKASKLRPITEHADTVLIPGIDNQPDRWLKHQNITINSGGERAYFATIYTDISEISQLMTEQENLTEQLNQLSTVDHESGLLNHRAMLQHLEPLVSRSRRYENHLSVISMGLLNLKSVAQQYGVDVAKRVITELSQLLKDQMRWADIVSRTDDDRFVFVLPETDKQSAIHLANKIATQVADMPINFDGKNIFIEASFGISAWEKGHDSVLLLRRASQALDAAKAKGNSAIEVV